jgi:hypothetical protein
MNSTHGGQDWTFRAIYPDNSHPFKLTLFYPEERNYKLIRNISNVYNMNVTFYASIL